MNKIQQCEEGDFKCFKETLKSVGYSPADIQKESDGNYHDCKVFGKTNWYVEIKARKMWVDEEKITYLAKYEKGKFVAGRYVGELPWIQTDKVARVENQAIEAGVKGAIAMLFVPSKMLYFFSIEDIKNCNKREEMMNKNTIKGEPKILKEVYEVPLSICMAKIPLKMDFDGAEEWIQTLFNNRKGED